MSFTVGFILTGVALLLFVAFGVWGLVEHTVTVGFVLGGVALILFVAVVFWAFDEHTPSERSEALMPY
jgi:hypothetical protein